MIAFGPNPDGGGIALHLLERAGQCGAASGFPALAVAPDLASHIFGVHLGAYAAASFVLEQVGR